MHPVFTLGAHFLDRTGMVMTWLLSLPGLTVDADLAAESRELAMAKV